MDFFTENFYGHSMGKVDYRSLTTEERKALERELFGLLQHLGLRKEGTLFVADLLTKSEITMLSRRIQIAKRLLAGVSLREIMEKLHVSPDTIRRVDMWLEEKFVAYRTILPPLLEEQAKGKAEKKRRRYRIPLDPYSFRGLRKRYPAHAVLLNCLLGDPQMYEEE